MVSKVLRVLCVWPLLWRQTCTWWWSLAAIAPPVDDISDVVLGHHRALLSAVLWDSFVVDGLVVQCRIRAVVAQNLVITEAAVDLFGKYFRLKTLNARVATSFLLLCILILPFSSLWLRHARGAAS